MQEYLDMDGLPEFVSGARNLLFGADSQAVKQHRIASLQSISGTGALGIAFDFIAKYLPRVVYISSPTWAIHRTLIEKHHLKGLKAAIPGSYVLLHPSAHNPTGFDLGEEQWRRVAEVMKKNSLIPFFDTAYQGFATGDFAKDAWAVRVIVRAIYSSPSKYGALVAARILNNPELFKEWETELRDVVAARIRQMRALLRSEL
ncbi:uncharacterized protein LOC116245309 [Nymphaea colorata]|nr:uncharacterized protein LOC116245309 [Nymphaea colorata]